VPLAPFFERIYSALGGHLSVSRDDLITSLGGVTVGIACTHEACPTDIWIAEFVTNLLARLYPRIAIRGAQEFQTRLQNIAVAINPEIEVCDEAPSRLTIGVGPATSGADLRAWSSGWVAGLGTSKRHPHAAENPYSAGVAATLAAAELFRRVFIKDWQDRCEAVVSLLNFDANSGLNAPLPSSDLGEVLFVGVGAIGNSAIWALARDRGRTGRLLLIDKEELELSNLQRYVLGTMGDISKQKVVLAQHALAATKFSVEAIKSTLEEYADVKGGITTRTVCISVDNVAGRRAAQALLPELIVNGWTGERSLGASWHVFSRDAACLACLYHPHAIGISQTDQAARALGLAPEKAALLWVTRMPLSDEDINTAAKKLGVDREALDPWRGKPLGDLYTDVVCGAVPISLPVSNRVETVPLAHQSALAGLLMAIELVKRTDPKLASMSQPEPLVAWDDVLREPPLIWPQPRARDKGCICGDPEYQRVYRSKWNVT
jgi:hypothetical protein